MLTLGEAVMTSGINTTGSRVAFRRSFIRAAGGRAACRRGPTSSRRLVLRAVLGKSPRTQSTEEAISASDEPAAEERQPVTCSSVERGILAALGWDR
jgi:hypothetical protein